MSSAAIGMSASALALSASAEHKAECTLVIQQYKPATATTEQMQIYADCIKYLYPDPMEPQDLYILKLLFVIALICGALGSWHFYKDFGEMMDGFMGFLLGFLIGPMIIIFIIAILCGIAWLLGVA